MNQDCGVLNVKKGGGGSTKIGKKYDVILSLVCCTVEVFNVFL